MKGSRWAVLKNPATLTGGNTESLAGITKTNSPLYRSYLIPEQLRGEVRLQDQPRWRLLAEVISWATRSRIPQTVESTRILRRFHGLITTTLDHGVTSALSENTNTHNRVLTNRTYDFHSPEAMIEITRGGPCPPPLGRAL